MKDKKVVKYFGKHTLTEEESYSKTRELLRANLDLPEIQNKKKEVVADFTAKEKKLEATIAELSRLLNNGYDYRNIDCTVDYNTPSVGRKQFTSVETGEVVGTETMTSDDFQMEIEEAHEAAEETALVVK